MTPDLLIKKLLAQREFSVEVEPGKRITLRRPAEMEVAGMLRFDAGKVVDIDIDVKRYAVGWEGIVEADFIVSGASDAVPFDASLFGTLIEDRREWFIACKSALLEKIVEHEGAVGDAQGN